MQITHKVLQQPALRLPDTLIMIMISSMTHFAVLGTAD